MRRTSGTLTLDSAPGGRAPDPGDREVAVDQARRQLASGGGVILVDDLMGEPPALVLSAGRMTDDAMARLIRHSSGIVWVAIDEARSLDLQLPAMVHEFSDTPEFTVSVDVARGTSTGISAADRTLTTRALVDPDCRPDELLRPGHIFPIRIPTRTMLRGPSLPAAALELTRGDGPIVGAAGASLAADDGAALDDDAIVRFAAATGSICVKVSEVARAQWAAETLVRARDIVEVHLFEHSFDAHVFESVLDGSRHLALVLGDVATGRPVPVAAVPSCAAAGFVDVEASPCRAKLVAAVEWIAAARHGVILRVPPDGESDEHRCLCSALMADRDSSVQSSAANAHAIAAQRLRVLGVRAALLRQVDALDGAGFGAYGVECIRVPERVAVAEGA